MCRSTAMQVRQLAKWWHHDRRCRGHAARHRAKATNGATGRRVSNNEGRCSMWVSGPRGGVSRERRSPAQTFQTNGHSFGTRILCHAVAMECARLVSMAACAWRGDIRYMAREHYAGANARRTIDRLWPDLGQPVDVYEDAHDSDEHGGHDRDDRDCGVCRAGGCAQPTSEQHISCSCRVRCTCASVVRLIQDSALYQIQTGCTLGFVPLSPPPSSRLPSTPVQLPSLELTATPSEPNQLTIL